jgi:hypothetical protein
MQTRVPVKFFQKNMGVENSCESESFSMVFDVGQNSTKVNLLKRGWQGSRQCMFCASDEIIDHLFFACPLARFVWGIFQCAFNTSTRQPQKMCEVNQWLNNMRLGHISVCFQYY